MSRKKLLRVSAIIWAISGIIILLGALVPILNYEVESRQDHPILLNPEVKGQTYVPTKSIDDKLNANNWFVGAKSNNTNISTRITYYTLSIESLGIKEARVLIGGDNLSKSLIQYQSTALPGKPGNTVIFGHSVLPVFFNPKNYVTIFSTLPTIKKGALISIAYDGVLYKYAVDDIFEILPTDLQVLDQTFFEPTLSLITCVPPGDPRNPRRLIVRASIIPIR